MGRDSRRRAENTEQETPGTRAEPGEFPLEPAWGSHTLSIPSPLPQQLQFVRTRNVKRRSFPKERIIYGLIRLHSVRELVILKGAPEKENLQGPRDPLFLQWPCPAGLLVPKVTPTLIGPCLTGLHTQPGAMRSSGQNKSLVVPKVGSMTIPFTQ